MTEDEAKTKPCIGPAPANTGIKMAERKEGYFVYGCAGSACLAWREDKDGAEWSNRKITDGAPPGGDWFQTQPSADGDTHITWKRNPHGYCGLVNRP